MAEKAGFNTEGMVGPISYGSDENVCLENGIPVDLPTNTFRWLYRAVVPVCAGDVLRIHGEARVTNDVGRLAGQTRYTVGVGWSLWWYDVDDTSGVPATTRIAQIGTSMGDNVDVPRHHMPLYITRRWKTPDNWVTGHRVAVVFRADAHSTSWAKNDDNDKLTVDNYGSLDIMRWTAPLIQVPPVEA